MIPFVKSKEILATLGMAQHYNVRPSVFFDLDEYTAYCFDEACYYIVTSMKEGKEPMFKVHATSFSEFYRKLGASNG